MPNLKLFHLPGACSRVTLAALEAAGCSYETQTINLMAGEQHSPEFRAINPNGKIPALLVDGDLLTENASILLWIHETYPDAKLFPTPSSALERAQQISDLFWVSSGWHPYVRANMMPIRWTTGDPEPVREKGRELLAPYVAKLDERLAKQAWYYGSEWSILDVYFFWCYTTAAKGGFDLSPYLNLKRHLAAVETHPSFIAAKRVEDQDLAKNEALNKSVKVLEGRA